MIDRAALLALALALACACAGEGDGAPATETAATTSEATATTTTTTTPKTGGGLSSCGEDYGPCDDDADHERCVHSDGASICGAECHEYGPGFASGRCEDSPLVLQTVCPVADGVPPACLISCETADHCPEPGMVCVPCPEPFVSACDAFDAYPSSEPRICAWPDP